MAETDNKPFDVNNLIALYQECAEDLDKNAKVDLVKYSKCMRELLKVFEGLGKAFSFAFSDLNDKTQHIEKIVTDPSMNDIEVLSNKDKEDKNEIPGDSKLSNMRALNRMAFVSLFVQEIFTKLAADKEKSLKPILQEAYKTTLELYHTWLVKKAVGAAFLASPSRESFLTSVGVSEEQLGLTPAYCENSQKIVDHIKKEFERLGLPWVFQ